MKSILLKKSIISMASIFFVTIHSDQISLENKTTEPIAVSIYYVNKFGKKVIKRAGVSQEILPGKTIFFERPQLKIGYDREFVFSPSLAVFQDTLDEQTFKILNKQNIGYSKGTKFYLGKQNGRFFAYSSFLKPVQDLAVLTKSQASKIVSKIVPENAYANQIAEVQIGNQLSMQEEQFIKERKKIIKNSLEKIMHLSITEHELPTVAVCFSGGGFRAMLGSIGFLYGLHEAKILDLITYVTVLSGSSWAVVPWIMSDKSLHYMNDFLKKTTQSNFYGITRKEYQDISLALLQKLVFDQRLSIIDLWGALIARSVMNKVIPFWATTSFSEATAFLKNGSLPLPIVTMVSNSLSIDYKEYQWFEATPYDVASQELKFSLPTWAFARYFEKGKSKNNAPGISASFLMGIAGSAFAVGMGDIFDRIPSPINKLERIMSPLINQFEKQYETLYRTRIVPGGYVHNPLYALDSCVKKDKKIIEFVDAGYAFNLALPPLLRPERAIDIVITFDLGAEIKEEGALKQAYNYAQKHGLRFPKINKEQFTKQQFSVFGNPDNKDELIIIYIPHIQNSRLPGILHEFDPIKASSLVGFASTFNFRYTENNAALLQLYAQETVYFHARQILNVIIRRIKAKKN